MNIQSLYEQHPNVNTFGKWNYEDATKQPNYTISFGNWGVFYSNMTKEQLLKFYPKLLRCSRAMVFGDLYLYHNGKCIRQINWQDYYTFIRVKN